MAAFCEAMTPARKFALLSAGFSNATVVHPAVTRSSGQSSARITPSLARCGRGISITAMRRVDGPCRWLVRIICLP